MIIYLGFWGFETRTYVSETGSLLYDYGTLENTQTEHNEYWSGGMVPGKKYRIEVEFIDKSGNKSATSSVEAWTKANAPSITIANNTTWTKSKTVTITGIANHNIRYTTNGVNPTEVTGTLLTGTGAKTFTINSNCTIKAVYVNTTTNQVNSSIGQASTTKIDTTVPTIAELTLVSSSANQIKVNAKGADTESGVKYYRFEKSTTSTTTGFTTETSYQVNTGTREHTYNVNANTTYYLRVAVVDQAGNEKISNVLTVKTLNPAPIITVETPDTWGNHKKITVKKAQGTDPNAKLGVWFVGPCGCRFEWQEIGNTVYVGYGNDPFKCDKHNTKPLYTSLNWDGETFSVELRIGNATVWANTRYDMQKVHGTESRVENLKIDSDPPTVSCKIEPGAAGRNNDCDGVVI